MKAIPRKAAATSRCLSMARVLALGLPTTLLPAMSLPVLAQTSAPAVTSEPAKPGAVSKAKTKSKETWADMKARWAKQKVRWAECQRREKLEKRSASAKRAYLEGCMTAQ